MAAPTQLACELLFFFFFFFFSFFFLPGWYLCQAHWLTDFSPNGQGDWPSRCGPCL